jgi:hypothetical protein
MLYGQTSSLSLSTAGSAASSVTLNVSLAFSGAGPSELLWTVTYPSGSVISITAAPGAAATSAGKTISCTIDDGSYTCMASGTNKTAIPNGVVSSLTLVLAPACPALP